MYLSSFIVIITLLSLLSMTHAVPVDTGTNRPADMSSTKSVSAGTTDSGFIKTMEPVIENLDSSEPVPVLGQLESRADPTVTNSTVPIDPNTANPMVASPVEPIVAGSGGPTDTNTATSVPTTLTDSGTDNWASDADIDEDVRKILADAIKVNAVSKELTQDAVKLAEDKFF